MKRPLFLTVFAFMAGIVLASRWGPIPFSLPLLCLAAALCLLLIFLRRQRALGALGILVLVFFLLGFLDMGLYRWQTPNAGHVVSYAGGEKITAEGVVCEEPRTSPEKTDLIVRVFKRYGNDGRDEWTHGKILLGVRPTLPLQYGDVIRFRARLRAPHNFQNPGGFDYTGYLRDRGILVRGFVAQPSDIVVLREGEGLIPLRCLASFRSYLKDLIEIRTPPPVAQIIQATVLGNQRDIPREVMAWFNTTGTSHIIAISGFNMGIVALFAAFLTRMVMTVFPSLLLRFDWRRMAAVASAILVTTYAMIAGAGVTVVRAALMVLVLVAAVLLGKRRDLENTLALAALTILVVSPYLLFDVSFQLSFAAVLALLFIAPRLSDWIRPGYGHEQSLRQRIIGKGGRMFLLFLAVTFSAVVGTLPIILFYFNRFSSVVLLANLLVVPVLGILAIPVCLCIILAALFWEPLTVLFIQIAAFLVSLSLFLVEKLASLPGASLLVATPRLWEIALYYLLLATGLWVLHHWRAHRETRRTEAPPPKRPWMTALFSLLWILALGMVLLSGNLRPAKTEEMILTAIDVGQGASGLVRLPDGTAILIGGGGFHGQAFDVGGHVVAPYLLHEGITSLNAVVLTHAHPDHLNGLLYILEHFQVQEIWTNGELPREDNAQRFVDLATRKGIPVYSLARGAIPLERAGIKITCLHPEAPVRQNSSASIVTYEDLNDHSLVLRLSYGKFHCLFPADISASVETALVAERLDLASSILFVPHHGSSRSSSEAFLDAVSPNVAVLSVGHDNAFRLPSPETLDRYDARQIKIYRTDRHGAVIIQTDGKDFSVKTYQK